MTSPLDSWVAREFERHPLLEGPYFSLLQKGLMEQQDFVDGQKQFYFAVRYFPRPMAALTARLPDSGLRAGLVENLAEEHGLVENGNGKLEGTLAHDRTFARFLATLGVGPADLAETKAGPRVRAFNTALMGTCLMEPPALAMGCLGIIEYSFAEISGRIGKAVTAHGWVPPEKLVHYTLHAELDQRHAADFFRVVEPEWNAGGAGRGDVEDGVALGLSLFHRLYCDLCPLSREPAHP